MVMLTSLAVSSDIRWHRSRVQLVTSPDTVNCREGRQETKKSIFREENFFSFSISGNCLSILGHKRGSWKLRVSVSSTKALPTAALRIHVKPRFLGLERENLFIFKVFCLFPPDCVWLWSPTIECGVLSVKELHEDPSWLHWKESSHLNYSWGLKPFGKKSGIHPSLVKKNQNHCKFVDQHAGPLS